MSEQIFSDDDIDCQTYETVGRLYECLDIEMLIESGQVADLSELLSFVKKSAASLQNELNLSGLKSSRPLTSEEFEAARIETARHLHLVAYDHKAVEKGH